MSEFEVPEPILSGPYDEPAEHWRIVEGEAPRVEPGRRLAMYYYRPPGPVSEGEGDGLGTLIELKLVNRIRQHLRDWQEAGRPGVTRTTLELLEYWMRDGRQQRLFFAQREAVETVIFLTEARAPTSCRVSRFRSTSRARSGGPPVTPPSAGSRARWPLAAARPL